MITINDDGDGITEITIDRNTVYSVDALTEEEEDKVLNIIYPITREINDSRRRRDAEEIFESFVQAEKEGKDYPLQVHGNPEQGFIHVRFKCTKDWENDQNNIIHFKKDHIYNLFNTTDGSICCIEFNSLGDRTNVFDFKSTYHTECNFYLYDALRMLVLENRKTHDGVVPPDDYVTLPHVVGIKDKPQVDWATDFFGIDYKSPGWVKYWDECIGIPEWQVFG